MSQTSLARNLVITRVDDHPFHMLPYLTSGSKKPIRNRLPFFRAYGKGLPNGIQALVLTSDLQGRENGGQNRLLGEVVAETLKQLTQTGSIPSPDAVFVCGDLYDYPDCHKRGGTGPVDEVFEALTRVAPRVVGVLGNHDVLRTPEQLSLSVDILDGKIIETAGALTVGGVSGIIGDPNRTQRRTGEAFVKAIEAVTNHRPDILLLHQGPTDPERPYRRGDSDVELSLLSGYGGLTVFGHTQWDAPWLIKLGAGQALNVDTRVVVLLRDSGPV